MFIRKSKREISRQVATSPAQEGGTFRSARHRGLIAARTFGRRAPTPTHFFVTSEERKHSILGHLPEPSKVTSFFFFWQFVIQPNIQEIWFFKTCTTSQCNSPEIIESQTMTCTVLCRQGLRPSSYSTKLWNLRESVRCNLLHQAEKPGTYSRNTSMY